MVDNVRALTEAIDLTDEILLLLDQEDFDAVRQLDERRLPLIKQAFAGSIDEVDQIKARHLLSLNQQVVERLNQFKQLVLEQQAKLRHSSKAVKAYQSHR